MTVALAIYGAGVSTLLAGLQIWREFFRRGRIGASMIWFETTSGPCLQFVLHNYGSGKVAIRAVRFRFRDEPEDTWAMPKELLRALPIVLDAGDVSQSFVLGAGDLVMHRGTADLALAVREGRAVGFTVETIDGRTETIPVPSPGQEAMTMHGIRARLRLRLGRRRPDILRAR